MGTYHSFSLEILIPPIKQLRLHFPSKFFSFIFLFFVVVYLPAPFLCAITHHIGSSGQLGHDLGVGSHPPALVETTREDVLETGKTSTKMNEDSQYFRLDLDHLLPLRQELYHLKSSNFGHLEDNSEPTHTVSAREIQIKDRILEILGKKLHDLRSQDNEIGQFPLKSIKLQNDFDDLMLIHRAAILEEMKSKGKNAQVWLKDLAALPPDTPKYLSDHWSQLLAGARKDYEISSASKFHQFFVNIYRAIFKNSKWQDENFDRLISKSIQTTSDRKIALALIRARRAGFSISPAEKRLLQKITNWPFAQLTQADRQYLEFLSGKTVDMRRMEKAWELLAHFSDLSGSYEKQVITLVTEALKALKSNSKEGLPWTKEQTNIVKKLEKLKESTQLQSLVFTEQEKALLHSLSEQTKLARRRLHLEQTLEGLQMKPPKDLKSIQLLEKVQNELKGTTQTYTHEEKHLNQEYASQRNLLESKLTTYATPNELDLQQITFPKSDTDSNKRALEVSLLLGRNLTPKQMKFLARLHQAVNSPDSFKAIQVEDLSKKFESRVNSLNEMEKLRQIIQGFQGIKSEELGVELEGLRKFQKVLKRGSLTPEELDLKIKILGLYEKIIQSMTPEEKAFQNLIWQKANPQTISQEEELLFNRMKSSGILNFNEKLKVVLYAKHHPNLSMESRAHKRLIDMREMHARFTPEEEQLMKQVEYGHVSELFEPEKFNDMKRLAIEHVLIEKLSISSTAREYMLSIVGKSKHRIFEDSLNKLLRHLTTSEYQRYSELSAAKGKLPQPGGNFGSLEIMLLLSKAERRASLDMLFETSSARKVKAFLELQAAKKEAEIKRLGEAIHQRRREFDACESLVAAKMGALPV
ncbi:hypothetical protein O181_069162 [Austropuccinia psidii MF-1]|uniref:Uncharacterized protein n=1 Tax=Austropuccinia psidii MF-1 TaxID=1389203 RepID=A0A9Q3F0S0_9BASI|nr:hypothetical protein [Austropuccinia psidii MF-1]